MCAITRLSVTKSPDLTSAVCRLRIPALVAAAVIDLDDEVIGFVFFSCGHAPQGYRVDAQTVTTAEVGVIVRRDTVC